MDIALQRDSDEEDWWTELGDIDGFGSERLAKRSVPRMILHE